jgi:hypothetical protein
LLAKKCLLLVFLYYIQIVNNGGRWDDTAQALAHWRYPVASSEALDVLKWLMCPALHRHIPMGIEIASVFPCLYL